MFRNCVRTTIALTIGFMLFAVASVSAGDDSDMAATVAAWEAAYNDGDDETTVAMYSSDACRMPPNAEPVWGSEAIMDHMKAGREAGWAQVKLALTEAHTDGGTGWASGTYSIHGEDGSEIDNGKWMNVSKKIDGEWKIYCDIFNSNLPLPGAE